MWVCVWVGGGGGVARLVGSLKFFEFDQYNLLKVNTRLCLLAFCSDSASGWEFRRAGQALEIFTYKFPWTVSLVLIELFW